MPAHTGTDEAVFTVRYDGPLPERVGFTLEVTEAHPDLFRPRRAAGMPG